MSADCVYASASWGLHDLRWTHALRELGHEPAVVVLGRDAGLDDLRSTVVTAAGGTLPVLAGPLTTVTRHLHVDDDLPKVLGLSWGFDLHDLRAAHDLAWLSGLTGLVVDSDPTMQIAIQAGMQESQLTFLPWGVDLELFTPEGSSFDLRSLDLKPGTRLLLSLRAHEPIYRVDEIISAFARVHADHADLVLLIGHSGSLTSSLRAQVAELGLEQCVRFIGSVEEQQVAELMRACVGYVSASEVDGTSVTLLQAMACGTPVIASDSPGNVSWVGPNTGFLFHVGSITQQAAAMSAALTMDVTRRTDAAMALVRNRADWHANL
ncbi:MAG: glycosyltransferase, partial [Actinomycetota bacterium]|nr:glycosyltransferase [Actinomycetota bacterium]